MSIRIPMDPMTKLRQARSDAVNRYFARLSGEQLHRDTAHRRKREIARDVAAGKAGNEAFSAEARLRGLEPLAFANQIKDRPDAIDDRELLRQNILIGIERAKTPDEIEAILKDAGIPADPNGRI